MATQKDRLIAALQKRGISIVPGKSKKFVTMQQNPKPPGSTTFYIGKAGALRCGRNVSESVSVLPEFKKKLLKGEPK